MRAARAANAVSTRLRRAGAIMLACTAMAVLTLDAAATEFGVYRGPGSIGRARIASFEAFVGRKVERTVDALNWFGTWTDLNASIPWVTRSWKDSDLGLTLSIPMIPTESGGTLADGAAGKPVMVNKGARIENGRMVGGTPTPMNRDQIFVEAGRQLVANGFADAVVRIGWEFNGKWMPWRADLDPENYVKYFQRIVIVMRSVPGQRFKFEWTPNHTRHAIDPDRVYPGDDYVDIIGMDVYDEIWSAGEKEPRARWTDYLKRPYGLEWHRNFAKAHGKPLAYSEWGVGQKPNGHGGGDNPHFVQQMAAWIAEVKPLYHNYWDNPSPTYDAELSEGGRYPRSSAMFRSVFGPKP